MREDITVERQEFEPQIEAHSDNVVSTLLINGTAVVADRSTGPHDNTDSFSGRRRA
jgi:hypothetical protein